MREIINTFLKTLVVENNAQGDPERKVINEFCVQFYLAMHLKESGFRIRLEEREGTGYLDLSAARNNERYVIEIKWLKVGGGVTDILRGVWRDTNRLENITNIKHGYFILVTNNHLFWSGGPYADSPMLYKCFSGNKVHIRHLDIDGLMSIQNERKTDWFPLLEPAAMDQDQFRFFLIEI